MEMHLVSRVEQAVRIPGAGMTVEFDAGESIHTENSYKYSIEGFRALAARAGFSGKKTWIDRKGLFALHGLNAS
jgi:uncharacterized SAM-dependent methyltransferase